MVAEAIAEQIRTIPVARLRPRPNQHRQYFDEEGLRSLADSMLAAGFITTLTVRPVGGASQDYEVICGHRRLRAAIMANLREVPCVIKHLSDTEALELELFDNLNNEHPLPWEEGEGFRALRDNVGLSIEAVAQRAGKTCPIVRDRLKIADACRGRHGTLLQKAYIDNRITLYTLVQLADLPFDDMSPKRCPGCQGVCREDAKTCPACSHDLGAVFAFSAGNPQNAALQLLLNGAAKCNAQVDEVIGQVKASYGLAPQVVQTSLGFCDVQISQVAVEVKSTVGRMMEKVGKIGDWLLKEQNVAEVRNYTGNQREALKQQIAAARSVLQRLERAIS